MESEKPRFIKGCFDKGLKDSDAEQLWALIQPFADYSFNKAHAACYAMISYQTAYLKAHYPAAFMAALMTSDYDDTDRLAIEIAECSAMGIKVLQPDVNESFGEFAVVRHDEGDRIRFGMNAIKNVGSNSVQEIIKARDEQHFTDLEDFLSKVDLRTLNRKTLESLIKSGAFDSFVQRADLIDNIEALQSFASHQQKSKVSGQTDLFGGQSDEVEFKAKLTLKPGREDLTEREQIIWERELLGIYLSKHPLSEYEEILKTHATPIKNLSDTKEGAQVSVGGSVAEVRNIVTKNGKKMAFVKLADMSGEIELIIFPKILDSTEELWRHDSVILVSGKISSKDRSGNIGDLKILVDKATEIDKGNLPDPIVSKEPRVYLRMSSTEDQEALGRLKEVIDESPGEIAVVLVVGPDESKQIIKIPTTINPTDDLLDSLRKIFGEKSVKYK